MPSGLDVASSLEEVVRLYHEAERKIKVVEHLDDELPLPSINELRYAGHHLARAWAAEQRSDPPARDSEIDKAARHCRRAIYDAFEIGIQYQLRKIRRFQDDYRKVVVGDAVKDYPELRRQATQANDFIQRTAAKFQGDREQYYAQCAEHYEAVTNVADTLDAARDDLNNRIRRDRNATLRAVILVPVVGGVIIAALRYFMPAAC